MKFIKLTLIYEELTQAGYDRQAEEMGAYAARQLKEKGYKPPGEEDEDADPIDKVLKESKRLYGGIEEDDIEEKIEQVEVDVSGFQFEPKDSEVEIKEMNYGVKYTKIVDMQESEDGTHLYLITGADVKVKETVDEIFNAIRLAQLNN